MENKYHHKINFLNNLASRKHKSSLIINIFLSYHSYGNQIGFASGITDLTNQDARDWLKDIIKQNMFN
jgi:hypothetical protein